MIFGGGGGLVTEEKGERLNYFKNHNSRNIAAREMRFSNLDWHLNSNKLVIKSKFARSLVFEIICSTEFSCTYF